MGGTPVADAYADFLATKALLETVQPRHDLVQAFMLHYTNIVEGDRLTAHARQMDQAVHDVKAAVVTGILGLGVGFALSAARTLGAAAQSLARTRELISRMPPPTGILSRATQWAIRNPSWGQLQGIIGPSALTGQSGAFAYHRCLNALSLMAGATAGAAMGGSWSSLGRSELSAVFGAAERKYQAVFLRMDPAVQTLLQLSNADLFELDAALRSGVAGELEKKHPKLDVETLRVLVARTLQLVWLDVYRKLEPLVPRLNCELAGARQQMSRPRGSGGASYSPGPDPSAY